MNWKAEFKVSYYSPSSGAVDGLIGSLQYLFFTLELGKFIVNFCISWYNLYNVLKSIKVLGMEAII